MVCRVGNGYKWIRIRYADLGFLRVERKPIELQKFKQPLPKVQRLISVISTDDRCDPYDKAIAIQSTMIWIIESMLA